MISRHCAQPRPLSVSANLGLECLGWFAFGPLPGRIRTNLAVLNLTNAAGCGIGAPYGYLGFLSDGNTLVSASDQEVRLWRAPSWAEIKAAEKWTQMQAQ